MPGAAQPKPSSAPSREAVWRRYREVRAETERLAAPLATEDYVVQSMPDASPPKWHLAHTTWFFETFVLAPYRAGLRAVPSALRLPVQLVLRDRRRRSARARRAACCRAPPSSEVYALPRARRSGDRRLIDAVGEPGLRRGRAAVIELGLHHEQQHQELLLTDLKHVFALNPLRPAYRAAARAIAGDGDAGRSAGSTSRPASAEIGHEGREFAFDNERPRHRVFLEAFAARRPAW